jgi:hypothetical protein
MASNSGAAATQQTNQNFPNKNGDLNELSSSSNVLKTSKNINRQPANGFDFNFPPNGYRVSPKITTLKKPTKAEIDFHLENFIMSRKFALNGGNELRIDDKNISLHLNNPFVTTFDAHQQSNKLQQQQQHQFKIQEQQKRQHFIQQQQQQQQQNFQSENEYLSQHKITDENVCYDRSMARPERPHSIPVPATVMSPSLHQQQQPNNDLKAPKNVHSLDNKKNLFLNKNYSHLIMNNDKTLDNEQNKLKEAEFYTPPSPISVAQCSVMPGPPVIAKRSQSIPRHMVAQNMMNPSMGMTSRPHSLDRYQDGSYNKNQGALQKAQMQNGDKNFGMKTSASFHSMSTSYDNPVDPNKRKGDRPLSYAYGTVPEQVYLEGQLRMYSEQLKYITESVRKYSEQARLLSELKRHQQQPKTSVPSSKSDSKLSINAKNNLSTVGSDSETPSHQLRIFLDSIRSSIKEPSIENETDAVEINGDLENKQECTSAKTPSDQLRKFLDEIRSNQFSDEIKTDAKEQCNNNNNNANSSNVGQKNMDQILDDFNQMALSLKTSNSVEYLRKYSEALKQTTEEIRLYNALHNNGNVGSTDSSCSTTPGSIREAVQNLLAQPNGFQIMDNRMSIFIDIMEQQDKLSQVTKKKCRNQMLVKVSIMEYFPLIFYQFLMSDFLSLLEN